MHMRRVDEMIVKFMSCTIAICFACSNVTAKPATPDYSNLKCQPDINVGDKISNGGCIDVAIEYKDMEDDGVFNPPKPNVIGINKIIKGTSDEPSTITHEVRHALNLKNKFCEKYGYSYSSKECGFIDELSAYISEGWSYEKSFAHIRDKYPEYKEVIDKIDVADKELNMSGNGFQTAIEQNKSKDKYGKGDRKSAYKKGAEEISEGGMAKQAKKEGVVKSSVNGAGMVVESQKYITCAYVREIKFAGKAAHAVLNDKGLHYQLVIYNKNTGKIISSYGKTTWNETPIVGQGIMLMEKPSTEEGYNPIPKWCVESDSISVLAPKGYVMGEKDCREYVDRIKDDLIKNHGGKEISTPAFALLEVKTKFSIDSSKLGALLKEQIAFVEALLAKGEKATQEDIDTYNSRQKKIVQEVISIVGKINSMATSKDEANRIAERESRNLMPLAEQLKSLVDQVVEREIVDHLESMSLNDLNSTATHQSTSDDSCCMCQVPEPNITLKIAVEVNGASARQPKLAG